jgi:hypothetical protein
MFSKKDSRIQGVRESSDMPKQYFLIININSGG